jgi:anthranilate synthase/phosphoribosyltransferase
MYLLIDNYDSFTHNVFQLLSELTTKTVLVKRNDEITLDEIERLAPEGIILSPGPGRPEDAGISLELVKRFAGKVPILGICLGHQTIAQAFGASIVGAKRIVHGKVDEIKLDGKGLFRSIPSPSPFTRYHSLVVDGGTLPSEFEVTATSPDGDIMGIRHRYFITLEGIQFHPESIASERGRRVLANFLDYKREPFPAERLLSRLIAGENLSFDEAAAFMDELTEGNLGESRTAAFLIALNAKGVVPEEIAGCASVLNRKKITLGTKEPSVDLCGTGGDGAGSFNISSMAALIAAAGGARVAKHGNRAVSSKSGSADFYRELGIPIDLKPEASKALLDSTGFAFLFAPIYHAAMRHAAAVRRELGVKTIMNLIGPLSNPADAAYQIIGVYDENLCMPILTAARLLGAKRVMTFHGDDGMDEISVSAPTRVCFCDEDGNVSDFRIKPEDFGIVPFAAIDLKGGTAAENASEARLIMDNAGRPALKEASLINAGAALFVCGKATSIMEGYRAASAVLASGAVKARFESIVLESAALAG